MPSQHTVIVGAQWGDEGKGKIVDYLASQYQAVVRYQGGHNAGHTVVVGQEKHVLHILPSGVLNSATVNIIAHGVVVDPAQVVLEMNRLKASGIFLDPTKLRISAMASIIHSYCSLLDKARDSDAAQTKIGTTGKGIGPAYEEKITRKAIKVQDLLNKDMLAQKLKSIWKERSIILQDLCRDSGFGASIPSVEQEVERLFELGKILAPFIGDEMELLDAIDAKGGNILYEGAQGVMLDIDYGTYPYVTSSSTALGGVYTGGYVPASGISEVLGIVKAYTTRVGEGKFPTELFDETGNYLQQKGNEVGATTGRKRRCGWLDLAQLKYAAKVSRLTGIILTKVDVLLGMNELKVGMSYQYQGKIFDRYVMGMNLNEIEAQYHNCRTLQGVIVPEMTKKDLPDAVGSYVALIEESLKIPVKYLAYGPQRTQLLKL